MICNGCHMIVRDESKHECKGRVSQLPLEELAKRIYDSKKKDLEDSNLPKKQYEQQLKEIEEEYNEQLQIAEENPSDV